MAIYSYLFDAEGEDRQFTEIDAAILQSVGDKQLLWIDIEGESSQERERMFRLLSLPKALQDSLTTSPLQSPRPRLDLYGNCFHFNVQAVQERETVLRAEPNNDDSTTSETIRSFKQKRDPAKDEPGKDRSGVFQIVTVHFVVLPGIVLTCHDEPADFLSSFDRGIKGDSHLGTLESPTFVSALLNWHITGYFRAMESLETEVDRIDDAAIRIKHGREEGALLKDMVRVRRRLALVRRALLPHREVYATLSRPLFAPFVTEQATAALSMLTERLERAIDATENARELVLGSFDIFTTQTALRTNEVVKTLTVISALLLPAGVIVNLGMLLIRAPVYDEGRLGFWLMITTMAVVGILFVVVARRRRWL